MTIRVAGAEGAGQIEFPLDVRPASPGVAAIVARLGLVGGVLGWGIVHLARRETRGMRRGG